MKRMLILLMPILMLSCKGQTQESSFTDGVKYGIDTMQKVAQPLIDSATLQSKRIIESYDLKNKIFNDSISLLKRQVDSLQKVIRYSDYRNGRIVTKIQYYIDITDRRPANKKYFFGWTKRAMRQEK